MPNPPAEKSTHFFDRQPHGSVRLRLRFTEDEANLIEEAAGRTPLIPWILRAVNDAARRDAEKARRSRPQVRPDL